MKPAREDLTGRIAHHFGPSPPSRLGVAVSGGSDSTALLILLAGWAGADLHVVTVDHGLRAEAPAEAAQVARLCARLGLPHDVLQWDGRGVRGNLMAAARAARTDLMARWARPRGIGDIALGHTQDDVAETFLMRLGRGAGLDGLAAMEARILRDGIRFHRPLLDVSRAALRDLLTARGIGWAEDPSNADMRFARVRARDAMRALELDRSALAGTAQALRAARTALEAAAAGHARRCITADRGDLLIDRGTFDALPDEMARRVMLLALHHVSGAVHGPRAAELARLLSGLDRSRTLMGCRLIARPGTLRITREWRAVAGLSARPGEIWDGRWRVEGPRGTGRHVAALGEAGLPHCPDRKATGLPAASLIASPAVWQGGTLLAAPVAGLAGGYTARVIRPWDAEAPLRGAPREEPGKRR